MGDLATLFDPDHVAVVGATDREGSVGRALLENLQQSFDGEIVPVNPSRETVFGLTCFDSISASPQSIDLAVLAVPAPITADVLREAVDAGVRDVVVISAGFGEDGTEGKQRQAELVEIAAANDVNLVGPNCVGILSTPNGLNATFAPENASPGSVSFMSQSGAFVTAVLDWAADTDIGFKDLVSLGNEAVLDAEDFAREWADDPDTNVILAYLEQITDGRAFIDSLREVTRETPAVVIKSGTSEAGAKAAASHTGSLAGSATAYRTGLDQAGAIYVEDVEDFFDFGQVLADQPLPNTNQVAVVTNSGGPGVLTADAIGASELTLAEFSGETRKTIAELLPETGHVSNPLDVVGDARVERYRGVLDAVLSDDDIGGVIAIACPTRTLPFTELAAMIVDLHETHAKPIVTCLMGGKLVHNAAHILQRRAIPNYFAPKRAVRSLEVLARYRDVQAREYDAPKTFDADTDRVYDILSNAAAENRTALGVEAMGILDAYGIPTPSSELVESADAAVSVADDIGSPVVMKLVSPDILHKSDVQGVRMNVELDDVADTFEDLVSVAQQVDPEATVLGVQIQSQVPVGHGQETIVGVKRDPQFGPLVMFGFGGIFVQVFEDTTFRVAPVSESEAEKMTTEITAAPLLRGARGRPPLAIGGIVDTIQRISQLAMDVPAIQELDVNPLITLPEEVSAVDLRLTFDPDRLRSSR